MSNGETRFIGAQIDKELHKKIKVKLAELDLTMHEVIILGITQYLGIDVKQYQDSDRAVSNL